MKYSGPRVLMYERHLRVKLYQEWGKWRWRVTFPYTGLAGSSKRFASSDKAKAHARETLQHATCRVSYQVK